MNRLENINNLHSGSVIEFIQTHEERADIATLMQYEPEADWFLEKPGAVHGIPHITRVLVLSESESNFRQVDREAIRWSAITHDLRRRDHPGDLAHGENASTWVAKNLSHKIPASSIGLVRYLNYWHVPDDRYVPEMLPELEVLKNADNADRVRLGDFELKYLRGEIAQLILPELAFILYLATADAHMLPVEDQFEYVLKKAAEIKIIRP